jgi:hypothetical protein
MIKLKLGLVDWPNSQTSTARTDKHVDCLTDQRIDESVHYLMVIGSDFPFLSKAPMQFSL